MHTDQGVLGAPRMYCPRCRTDVARAACREIALGDERAMLCPTCGMVTRPAVDEAHAPMGSLVRAAFARPLAGDGWRVWTVLTVSMSVLAWFGRLGALAGTCLAALYVFSALQHAAHGRHAMPDPVDVESIGDLRGAWSRLVAAMLVTCGPLGCALTLDLPDAARGVAVLVGAAWFAVTLPGVMAVAAFSSSALNLLRIAPVFQMAARIPRDYAQLSAICLAVLAADLALSAALGVIGAVLSGVPVVSFAVDVAARGATLYPMMALACLVGEVIHGRRHALGWEGT